MLEVGMRKETVRDLMVSRGIDKYLIYTVVGDTMDIYHTKVSPTTDTIVSSVVQKFLSRSAAGIKKYGTTLDRKDLHVSDWITHAQEELMDGILYLEKLKQTI